MRSSSSRLLGAYAAVSLAALLLPIAVLVVFSFSADSSFAFPPSGLSLRWFAYLAQRDELVTAALISAEIALIASMAAVVLGALASLGLVRERVPGKALIEGILMSPLTLPGIVTGVAFLQFVSLIGLRASFWRLVLAHVVICTPYAIRSITANLYGIDPSLEEASHVLGANRWRTFRRILLPLMKPGITAAFIFSFITSFDNVVVSMFLISGDTVTLPVRVLTYVEWQFDPSIAAISTILTALTTTLVIAAGFLGGEDIRRLHRLRR
jgi:putative spermidine/putrescine transport system permease protein